ncbi:MAG: hypothetical protein ACK40G_05370 [Cytophagaceae bacterium]
MKKLLILILVVLVAYCTFSPSNVKDTESKALMEIRLKNAQAKFIKPSEPYVNNGFVDINFANNGISVWQLTSSIMNKYDQDKDGIVDVSKDTFLKTESSSGGAVVIKTESRGLLFMEADRVEKQDGRVLAEELFAYISTFDEDNNGELTTDKSIREYIFGGYSEWDKFENNFEERYKYDTK